MSGGFIRGTILRPVTTTMVTIAIIIALVTMSWGFLLTWPLSIVWGVVATIAHERT